MYKKLRFLFTLFMFLFIGSGAIAQYSTPGNNLSLTLQDLVDMSEGVVTTSDGEYFIHNELTISVSDTLNILQSGVIRTAAGIRINIMGAFFSDPIEGQVVFTAQDTTSAASNFKGFRFEDADYSVFRNTTVMYGGGIQLLDTEVLFEHSVFRNNGHSNVSAAINYSSCSPVIRYCEFRENSRSAIASGANIVGSPQIMHSSFIHNTTENSNRPQINLGPGDADTIKIVGNYVEGLYTIAGGIAVSNLLGGGSSKVLVADNIIVDNRYGYAQTGNNISSVIRGNIILDNNIQDNPMQGGSGLNFNGVTNNFALVRGNLVSGNLWGVTIQNTAQPDFGTADDQGGNVFYNNGNNGITYALYNNTPNPVTAIGNYWGANDAATAENYIVHQPDDSNLGLVTYEPIMTLHPDIVSFAFMAVQNDALESDAYGVISSENHHITVYVPDGTDVSQLIPEIAVPLGVSINPESGEAQDFSQVVEYTLSVPHGDEQVWTVSVEVEQPEVYNVTFMVTDEDELPVENAVITLNGTTNDAGNYVFEELLPGTYDYTITAEGYEAVAGSVEIADEDVIIEVTMMLLTYNLTFVVTDEEGSPVIDAMITLDDVEYSAGEYVFEDLLPGTYDYEVAADGFVTVAGSVEIIDQDVDVLIEMEIFVSVNEIADEVFRFYPNPASEYVVTGNTSGQAAQLTITDLSGKILLQATVEVGEQRVVLAGLSEGIYLIRIVAGNSILVKKLSVVK